METLTQPTLLLKPFAENGDKNQIPLNNETILQPQLADLTVGFPPITSKDPNDGGLPPERKDFNALGYLTTSYDFFYQAGGTFTFSSIISNAIGGYPLGARLWYTDSNGISCILRSTIANNTNDFTQDDSVIGEAGSGKPWEIENFKGISNKGNLFDCKWADHILNDISWLRADTFSWQSGAVYKEAYDELSDQYANGTDETSYLKENVTTIGRLTNNNYVLSGFSQSNYAQLPTNFVPTNKTWEMVFKVTTGADISNDRKIFNSITAQYTGTGMDIDVYQGYFRWGASSNGSSWDIANFPSMYAVSANTTYYIKLEFTGSAYNFYVSSTSIFSDNPTYTITSSAKINVTSGQTLIGFQYGLTSDNYAWGGSIDLKESYIKIDGELWWRGCIGVDYKRTPKGYKIVDASQEQTVANIYNNIGVAWYYILDTTNQRFKLPRTKYGFVGLRDTVGKYVPESLPNIKGQYWYISGGQQTSGAFYNDTTHSSNTAYGNSINGTLGFNASLSSSTYQDNAPVQQRATQMYLYFYVGNYTQAAIEQTAGITSEQLNQKLDLDAGNANSTTKETIVGWGIPDYSTGVEFSLTGASFVAPYDCVVFYRSGLQNTATEIFYLNGVYSIVNQGSYSAWTRSMSIFPMRKGDVLSGLAGNDGNRNSGLLYFKMKGLVNA